jgi:hypothetical protein
MLKYSEFVVLDDNGHRLDECTEAVGTGVRRNDRSFFGLPVASRIVAVATARSVLKLNPLEVTCLYASGSVWF